MQTFMMALRVARPWGALASSEGLSASLLIAAATMGASTVLALRFRLDAADGVDVRPAAYQPQPHVEVLVDGNDGPVLLQVEYRVARDRLAEFANAARELVHVRRRAGAMHWALYQDTEHSEVQVESYVLSSWTEHKRQAECQTVTDKRVIDAVAAYHTGVGSPIARYMLGHHFRHHPQPARAEAPRPRRITR